MKTIKKYKKKVVKISISIDAEDLRAIDENAKKFNISRSKWIAYAGANYVPKEVELVENGKHKKVG